MGVTRIRRPPRPEAIRAATLVVCLGLPAALSAQSPGFSLELDRGGTAALLPFPDVSGSPVLAPPAVPRRFWLAAGEVALVELLPWVYDRYLTNQDYARISWSTVSRNFKAGFGFDSDDFNVNQSSHPYQGSLFFEAGRSNGYTYWESGLFALAGSFVWECCMENTQPSINDLVNTTLGGMTRGEVSHRLAEMILDNTSTGGERLWREIAAGIVNPIGALTRLVDGDAARQFRNPDDRFPDGFGLMGEAGYRQVEGTGVAHEDQAALSLSARYGDPFIDDVRQPFDSFTAAIDVDAPNDPAITRFEERGILRSWELTDRGAPSRHVFAFSQEYEYINNVSQVVGAQMFSAGFLSRYALGGGLVATTDFDALAIPLAGIQTANFENPETGRNYDYGVGTGALAAIRLYGGDHQLVNLGYGFAWVHTVNGGSDENFLQFFRAAAIFPIDGPFGVGAGYRWYSRKTTYPGGYFEPRQMQSEWRVFLSLSFGASGLRPPKV